MTNGYDLKHTHTNRSIHTHTNKEMIFQIIAFSQRILGIIFILIYIYPSLRINHLNSFQLPICHTAFDFFGEERKNYLIFWSLTDNLNELRKFCKKIE